MTEKPTKKDALAPRKRWPKHGLYCWIDIEAAAGGAGRSRRSGGSWGTLRTELIEAHGGEKITPDQRILIDSVVEALGIQKLSSLYLRRYGVIDGVAAGAGRLELNPILGKNWLAFGNTVRQGVLALAELERARKQEDRGPTLIEILAEAVRGRGKRRSRPRHTGQRMAPVARRRAKRSPQ